jgi:hypothetical protein
MRLTSGPVKVKSLASGDVPTAGNWYARDVQMRVSVRFRS